MLFLVLVLNLRFLSARCGPTALTSTKGRNMALVCQLRLFTPTTGGISTAGSDVKEQLLVAVEVPQGKLDTLFMLCVL